MSIKKYTKNRVKSIINRFKNCVILRLEINKNNDNNDNIDLKLNIVYEGNVSDRELKKKIYYTNKNENEHIGYINFIDQTNEFNGGSKTKSKTIKHSIINEINLSLTNDKFMKLFELSTSDIKFSDEYVFYLIRHGQAEHNIMKGLTKKKQSFFGKKDTSLTDQGIDDAITAGKYLKKYIEQKHENIDYYFVSDLHRTRQTLFNILNGMKPASTPSQPTEYTAYVLNCAHEVVYKNKNCDISFLPDASENLQCCTRSENALGKSICGGVTENNCNKIVNDKINLIINWEYYNQNYRNKKLCKNTNLISEAINII